MGRKRIKSNKKNKKTYRLTIVLAARSHTQSMDVDKEEAFTHYEMSTEGFSYLSEVRARDLLIWEKKHLDHQNSEI